jgi:hypothetical protein
MERSYSRLVTYVTSIRSIRMKGLGMGRAEHGGWKARRAAVDTGKTQTNSPFSDYQL